MNSFSQPARLKESAEVGPRTPVEPINGFPSKADS